MEEPNEEKLQPETMFQVEVTAELEEKPASHDSLVTVRLSEPPSLTLNTNIPEIVSNNRASSSPSGEGDETPSASVVNEIAREEAEGEEEEPPLDQMQDHSGGEVDSARASEPTGAQNPGSRKGSNSSEESTHDVNWEELEKTEEQEPRDQGSDDSTTLLLARLEQENNLIASNPKAGIAKTQNTDKYPAREQSRPPSMHQLKKLVNEPTPPALRYSVIPPPPMTDLEFYAALVQDYTRTAQRLPTLLSKKIRSGVPPPLRGVVWQSVSGARDSLLGDQFDRLCGETSPYEGIIGKDLGRSFPGVEMFRDPDGDGQRMLGRVLKCFSLYDHKIGYCQGLGFLVGPLLMHMGDKQAFCVLVRLMEHYDLRSCFLPDLSGLHVRIHQFRELLKRHIPKLSKHLDDLQIEPQYVSQWFLSFFAVTCPLPMLFRIYDVIFAEGASETIMRVALSLMRKNEEKILACTEFEDVMQLLLSRELWDCYHYNADELVNDFVSLTGEVTHDSLQALEASFKDSEHGGAVVPSENIGSAASRFLGRLWAGSNASTKSTNLSPGLSAPSRPVSFLRRSPSKQSLASTLNSMEVGSDSALSCGTDATSISRDSSNTDESSNQTHSANSTNGAMKSNKDKNLHGQIEDLLTALTEMQRDHAILATQLQKEREEREEDRHAVRSLLDGLRKKASSETVNTHSSDESLETVRPATDDEAPKDNDEDSASTILSSPEDSEGNEVAVSEPAIVGDDVSQLLDVVEERFNAPVDHRTSFMLQSKLELRDELARTKEHLHTEVSKSQDFSRQLLEQNQELQNLKDQVKEGHVLIRNGHADKQRLEKLIQELRVKSAASSPDGSKDSEIEGPVRSSSGLRELKLGRANSTRSQGPAFNKRTSSLNQPATREGEYSNSSSSTSNTKEVDADALVLELVQAKTAEAVAHQEAEEAKAKLESLRKMLGLNHGESPGHRASPSVPPTMIERSTTFSLSKAFAQKAEPASAPATSGAASTGGGFWAGWGKRTVSSTSITTSGSG